LLEGKSPEAKQKTQNPGKTTMLLVSATRPLTFKVSLPSPAFSLKTHMESAPRTVLNSVSHSAQTKSDIKDIGMASL